MKPVEILLVEDSLSDIRLIQEAFNQSHWHYHLSIVEDGVAALDFLYQRGHYAAAPRPDLILLDLNLPKKSGLEVLGDIKTAQGLKQIPVIILSTSEDEGDILRAYNLHANCYITKPLTMTQFMLIVEQIKVFWFSIVKLPK